MRAQRYVGSSFIIVGLAALLGAAVMLLNVHSLSTLVQRASALAELPSGRRVVVVGHVSHTTRPLLIDGKDSQVVAYQEEDQKEEWSFDGLKTIRTVTPPLIIDTLDGTVTVPQGYALIVPPSQRRYLYGGSSFIRELMYDDPVAVIGVVQHGSDRPVIIAAVVARDVQDDGRSAYVVGQTALSAIGALLALLIGIGCIWYAGLPIRDNRSLIPRSEDHGR